jgi:hypothetical protein
MVVDHRLRMRAAWKNSMVWGVSNIPIERSDFASLKSWGARLDATSCVVWRTAIKQQAQSSKGDFLTSANSISAEMMGLNNTHLP